MKWQAEAPSNIALIKYAGKKNKDNIPLNSSLSYTLEHFTTSVLIEPLKEGVEDQWAPLQKEFKLSALAQERFLIFFKFLKKTFKIPGFYLIKSGNNFLTSAGAASSASSFSALTTVAHRLALDLSLDRENVKSFDLFKLSALSRKGSGSSCRSFFKPWALWENEGAKPLRLPFLHLKHQLIVCFAGPKNISSSKGHELIVTSPFFKGRADRARGRLFCLLKALKEKNWPACFDIVWEEFQDLHKMYETARPSAVYRTEGSFKVLNWLKNFWKKNKDGPLVTMDAGSSVHLLYRPDQEKTAEKIKTHFESDFKVFSS